MLALKIDMVTDITAQEPQRSVCNFSDPHLWPLFKLIIYIPIKANFVQDILIGLFFVFVLFVYILQMYHVLTF